MKGVTVQELSDNKSYGLELEVLSGFKGLSRKITTREYKSLVLL